MAAVRRNKSGPWSTLVAVCSESPHQAVAVKGGVDAAKEEPAGPQILQSELQDEVGQQHQRPHHHELEDGVRAARRRQKECGAVSVSGPMRFAANARGFSHTNTQKQLLMLMLLLLAL